MSKKKDTVRKAGAGKDDAKPETSQPKGAKAMLARFWRSWILPIGVVVAIGLTLRSTVVDWNDVPTGSMNPTIIEGDRVFVNKLAYDLKVPFTTWHIAQWGDPQRGDIVIFYSPEGGERTVKRVVGLPGDRIELHGDRLLINGQPVPSETGHRDPDSPPAPSPQFFMNETLDGRTHPIVLMPDHHKAKQELQPMTVPEGKYFMMGDNRDRSSDSRFWGPVERRYIVGRASRVLLSVDPAHYYVPRWHRFFRSLP